MIIRPYMMYLLCIFVSVISISSNILNITLIDPLINMLLSFVPLIIWFIGYYLEQEEKYKKSNTFIPKEIDIK